MWTDWRKTGAIWKGRLAAITTTTTRRVVVDRTGQEEVLELAPDVHISHISGLSYDFDGSTYSLMAETSANQRLEPLDRY